MAYAAHATPLLTRKAVKVRVLRANAQATIRTEAGALDMNLSGWEVAGGLQPLCRVLKCQVKWSDKSGVSVSCQTATRRRIVNASSRPLGVTYTVTAVALAVTANSDTFNTFTATDTQATRALSGVDDCDP